MINRFILMSLLLPNFVCPMEILKVQKVKREARDEESSRLAELVTGSKEQRFIKNASYYIHTYKVNSTEDSALEYYTSEGTLIVRIPLNTDFTLKQALERFGKNFLDSKAPRPQPSTYHFKHYAYESCDRYYSSFSQIIFYDKHGNKIKVYPIKVRDRKGSFEDKLPIIVQSPCKGRIAAQGKIYISTKKYVILLQKILQKPSTFKKLDLEKVKKTQDLVDIKEQHFGTRVHGLGDDFDFGGCLVQ